MALLNYVAQRKGKKGKRGKKAHFLGVCSRPETATCFHQRLLPLMQNGVQGNRGTIKPACCFCFSIPQPPLSLWGGTTWCHLYTGPHPPQINPNLAIKHRAVQRGRRQVIDILRCMSFVYVVTLSQGLSPWMTADPVCIRHLIREPCMSDCSAAHSPVAFQQRTFQ